MRALWLSASLLLAACSVGGDEDAGSGMDADRVMEAGFADRQLSDSQIDPFDADASCGHAIIESERLPGSLLFVFDRSGSMDAAPTTGPGPPTRWSIAGDAVRAVLAEMDGDTNVGMLLFPPQGSMCNVALGARVPQVPIAPLSASGAAITLELSRTPDGVATPIFDALRSGWSHLGALGARGERALVLVTDGRENCADDERDAVLAQATDELRTNGHLTFVIGLTQSNTELSTLALNGGTRRNDTCLGQCTTPSCVIDSDDPCPATGAACATFPDGETGSARVAGFCGCITSADCPAGMTCETAGGDMVCAGVPNCCHYNASVGRFEADFRAALDAIADVVTDTCIFDLPRGDDPSMFDPSQVNVRVTIGASPPEVIGRSSDPSVDSWAYASTDQRSIVIQGPLCDRIREGTATVEIVLGCPTVLI